MTPVLLVNSAVSLIVGAALLFVWQRDAAQRFCRDLGAAFLVQSMAPPVFLLWRACPAARHRRVGLEALSVFPGEAVTPTRIVVASPASAVAGSPSGKSNVTGNATTSDSFSTAAKFSSPVGMISLAGRMNPLAPVSRSSIEYPRILYGVLPAP